MALKSTKNKAFLGAYRKGQRAAEQGLERKPPYPDLRGGASGQGITFSRAFRGYWLDGYDDAKARTERRAPRDLLSPGTEE